MEKLSEFTVEHKEDVWKIPAETRVLRIKCKLNLHSAKKIIMHCRELEKIIFAEGTQKLSPAEAVEYLSREVYEISAENAFEHKKVPALMEKEIKKLYARGDHNLHSLSLMFDLPKEKIWHIIHDKPLKSGKND